MVCLCAVKALRAPSMMSVTNVMSGKTVEGWRYATGAIPEDIKEQMAKLKERAHKKQRTTAFLKNMISLLESEGYLETHLEKKNMNGRSVSWSVFELTMRGAKAMKEGGAIMLPVPASIRQQEEEEEKKRLQLEKMLEEAGVKIGSVPEAELEAGEGGKFTQAVLLWDKTKKCNTELTPCLEDLERRIRAWQAEMAQSLRIAPGNVIREDLLARVCYVSKNGAMEESALVQIGVR